MKNSSRFKKIRDKSDIIFKSRFLKKMTMLERTEFLQYCHHREYNKDEFIYYQGDPGTGMYFIEQGKVLLIADPGLGTEGESQSYQIEAPESFGSLSIGYELRRVYSVKCLTDCTLLGFFKPDFETLKNRHPSIAVKFMETLAMIAMKQLELVTNELRKTGKFHKAFSLQFETYFDDTEGSF